MPKYEVPIVYVGQSNYIIEAASPEEAEQKARDRFKEGDDPDVLGREDILGIGIIQEVEEDADETH